MPIQKKWADQVIHRKYYPHIDGLRCLAVMPVVFFHLASWICPGGFVGVDVFFVISGYLIYGGILEDLQKGTFTMASFYHRRIRRIFPAYFAVVFCTLLTGIVLYHWARLVPLAQTALFSTFFSTNFYFWLDIGYFRPNAMRTLSCISGPSASKSSSTLSFLFYRWRSGRFPAPV